MRSSSSSLLAAVVLAVLLCSIGTAAASEAVSAVAAPTCGFAGLDFSSLMHQDILGSDGTSPPIYNYYLSVCGVLSSTPTTPCTQIQADASACQMQVSGGTGTFDIGNWVAASPPQWGYIDPNNQALGVMYQISGANSCWAHPPVQTYFANVLFVCSPTGSGQLVITVPAGSCVQNYTIATPLACAPPAPKCGTTLGGKTYDFTSLMGVNMQGSDSSSPQYEYYLSVCGDLSEGSGCAVVDSAASSCQVQQSGGSGVWITGEYNASSTELEWSYIDPSHPGTGVQYQLSGQNTCWAEGTPQPWNTVVQLQCGGIVGQSFAVTTSGCNQTLTVTTPISCIPECKATLGSSSYDFSSLASADLVGSDGLPEHSYLLRLCGFISSANAAGCLRVAANASSCELDYNLQQSFVTGEFSGDAGALQWSFIGGNPEIGLEYALPGGGPCDGSPQSTYAVTVQLLCGKNQGTGFAVYSNATSPCTQTYALTTPLACPESAVLSDAGASDLLKQAIEEEQESSLF